SSTTGSSSFFASAANSGASDAAQASSTSTRRITGFVIGKPPLEITTAQGAAHGVSGSIRPLTLCAALEHVSRAARYKSVHNSEPPLGFFFAFLRVAAGTLLRRGRFAV